MWCILDRRRSGEGKENAARSPRLHVFQRLQRGDTVASDYDSAASIAILPYVGIACLRMNLFDGIIDNEIEEHVESSKCALDLSSALDVDSNALVKEALELRLRYFGHLAVYVKSPDVLERCGCWSRWMSKRW